MSIDPNDLINNLESVREEIASESGKTNNDDDDDEEVETKKRELLLLSGDGEIVKSVAYIKKASAKVIKKLYADYEAKRLEKASEFLCDQFLLASIMGGLDAIEKPEDLERES